MNYSEQLMNKTNTMIIVREENLCSTKLNYPFKEGKLNDIIVTDGDIMRTG